MIEQRVIDRLNPQKSETLIILADPQRSGGTTLGSLRRRGMILSGITNRAATWSMLRNMGSLPSKSRP